MSLLWGWMAGLLAGILYFASLIPVVRWLVAGRSAAALLLQLLRLAMLAALLMPVARLGAGPLLAGLTGVLMARSLVLWRSRRP